MKTTLRISCLSMMALTIGVADVRQTHGQDRQAAIIALDNAILAVEALLGGQPIAAPEQYALAEFQNHGTQPVELLVYSVDSATGQQVKQPYGPVAAKMRRQVEVLPEEIWCVVQDGKIIAEYMANYEFEQIVDLQELAALWRKQPEPRSPLMQLDVIFQDFGSEPLQVYAFDPQTGELLAEPIATLKAESELIIQAFPGDVCVLKDMAEATLGEYQVNDLLEQVVHCGKLRAAWRKQGEPRKALILNESPQGLVFSPANGSIRVKGIFVNNTDRPAQIHARFKDPRSGEQRTVLRKTIQPEAFLELEMDGQVVWVIKQPAAADTSQTNVLAEFVAGKSESQVVMIKALAAAWQAHDKARPLTKAGAGFQAASVPAQD